VIIVSRLSKVMKVEKQVSIANFVKPSIPNTLISFKIILNGSGRESDKDENILCQCKNTLLLIISFSSYNMRPQDFSSEEAYNAYLEQREDMSINIF
jgi:hypothetical protein